MSTPPAYHPQKLGPLPRRDPDHTEQEPPLASAQWLSQRVVRDAIRAAEGETFRSPIILGQVWDGDRNHVFVADDDRHLVTIAGSRAGKGNGLVIPNLLAYPGSVVCIDPKGENAAVTARYRHAVLGQNVVILDPFAVLGNVDALATYRGTFNPFEWINPKHPEAIDDVAALADAIIMRDQSHDPHWNESARMFLKGVMLLVMSMLPTYQEDTQSREVLAVNWTLGLVRQLASTGIRLPIAESGEVAEASLEGLLTVMKQDQGFGGAIAAAGHFLEQMGDRERGGVLSSLRRHTEFLESPPIKAVLESSDFSPFKIGSEPTTIYLVLPEWRMATHARWLRVVVTVLLHGLQRGERRPEQPATLLILDEFAALGPMQSIERAAGYIAGFGVKLWILLQDLNQLKDLYAARWETFLGNAGTLTAFGNVDVTTLEYLSRRLGKTEVRRKVLSESVQQGSGETHRGLGHLFEAFAHGKLTHAFAGPDGESVQSGYSASLQESLQAVPLLSPDEIARMFSRDAETVLVHIAGQHPFRLNRIRYHLDHPFAERAGPTPYH